MKLIHCSDIHLDSPLCSRLPGRLASERRSELRSAFAALLRRAEGEGARAVIVAGDLFDGSPSPAGVNFVIGEVAAHPGVDLLYLPGNHDTAADSLLEESALPENLHIFPAGFSTVDYDGVVIGAVRGSLSEYEPRFDPSRKNILVLHGQIADSATGDDSIVPRALADHAIDYAALGHIHSYKSGKIDDRGIWCYSGCPAARGFDECGERGFVLLETDTPSGKINSEFIPLGGRVFHDISLPLDGISDVHALRERAQAALTDIQSDDILRFTLTGSRDPSLSSYAEYLKSAFGGIYAHFEVKDRSRIAIDPADYEGDISVRGEFVRLVFANESLSDEERDLLLSIGLRTLDGERPEH